MSINIVQYNILSSKLCDPDYYRWCNVTDLEPKNRIKKICEYLKEEISKNSIICLQEISREWQGILFDFFSNNKYYFVSSLYGFDYGSRLGIGIAYPSDLYESKNTKVQRVGEKIPTDNLEVNDYWYNKMYNYVYGKLGFFQKKPVSIWVKSKNKNNTSITLTLKHKISQMEFVVSTYHMPCEFKDPGVMTLHINSLLRSLQQYNHKNLPIILAMDGNFKPISPQYRYITKGTYDDSDVFNFPQYDLDNQVSPFSYDIIPMNSLFQSVMCREPKCTNQTFNKNMTELFSETIDYIFYTKLYPIGAECPTLNPNDVLPNDDHPSDHIPLKGIFNFNF